MLAESAKNTNNAEGVSCEHCGNLIDSCMCECPYCGEVDACECCLFDAATGG